MMSKKLREERHYPSFLDELKKTVVDNILHKIEMVKNTKMSKFIYDISLKTKYVNEIEIDITLLYGEDINDRQKYAAFYYNVNNGLINGKLNKPKLIINCPFDGNKTNNSILRYCVSHELTHLYDDWVMLSNGKDGINFNELNTESTLFIQTCMKNGTDFTKGVGGLCYMSLKVEKQAFLSQTIQELEGIGCNAYNYREKMKETVFYNNLTKSYKMFMNVINCCNDNELIWFNDFVFRNYPKANIPKYDTKTVKAPILRKKLVTWGDNVYHKVMNSYNSVVSYYIDKETDKLMSENYCILVL